VFGALNKANFNNIENLVPSEGVVEFFDRITSPIDMKIYINELTIQNLMKLRDSLLHKLMSGQIRVGQDNHA